MSSHHVCSICSLEMKWKMKWYLVFGRFLFLNVLRKVESSVISLQFVRKQFGRRFASSSTGSQTLRSTVPGFTPASMKTSAWMTWPRTLAALRSTWTWWPEWVLHQHYPNALSPFYYKQLSCFVFFCHVFHIIDLQYEFKVLILFFTSRE